MSVALGPTLIEVLEAVYHDGPLGIQANYARRHDQEIAALASLGLITSIALDGTPTRQWRLTPRGSTALCEDRYKELMQ